MITRIPLSCARRELPSSSVGPAPTWRRLGRPNSQRRPLWALMKTPPRMTPVHQHALCAWACGTPPLRQSPPPPPVLEHCASRDDAPRLSLMSCLALGRALWRAVECAKSECWGPGGLKTGPCAVDLGAAGCVGWLVAGGPRPPFRTGAKAVGQAGPWWLDQCSGSKISPRSVQTQVLQGSLTSGASVLTPATRRAGVL